MVRLQSKATTPGPSVARRGAESWKQTGSTDKPEEKTMKAKTVAVNILVTAGAVMVVFAVGSAHAFNEGDVAKLKDKKECKGCDLSGADLYRASLKWANLSGANLCNANLDSANLMMANLEKADLRNFKPGKLTYDQLYGTKLSGAKWRDGQECKQGSVSQCIRD